jgi:hypothetical protein
MNKPPAILFTVLGGLWRNPSAFNDFWVKLKWPEMKLPFYNAGGGGVARVSHAIKRRESTSSSTEYIQSAGFLSSRPNRVPHPLTSKGCCSSPPLGPRGETHWLAGEGTQVRPTKG